MLLEGPLQLLDRPIPFPQGNKDRNCAHSGRETGVSFKRLLKILDGRSAAFRSPIIQNRGSP